MYKIHQKLAKRSNYHLPDEARKYYGKYARDGITVHWWNSPSRIKDSDHDVIVNYIYNKKGGSVNYVLSNNKITLMVNPDNVAWASQSGNPTTISIEFSPHLNAEGYKKAGWLIKELESRYGKGLRLFKHAYWFFTECPGNLDLNRMRSEADKWKRGEYDPKPAPTVIADLKWTKLAKPTVYVTNKPVTNLWSFKKTSWDMTGVKQFKKGEKITIYGRVHNRTLDAHYLLTEYSYTNKIANGFNEKDLDLFVELKSVEMPVPPKEQQPQPKPPVIPEPVEPTLEERVSKLEALVATIINFLSSVFKQFK